MSKLNTAALYLIGALLVVVVGMVWGFNTYLAQGSVIQGNEYESVVVTSDDTGTTSLKTFGGSLAQVTVTDASTAGANGDPLIIFYDVTATTAATTTLNTNGYNFAEVGTGSAAETTFIFDASAGKGIMMWVNAAFDGNATVMYR